MDSTNHCNTLQKTRTLCLTMMWRTIHSKGFSQLRLMEHTFSPSPFSRNPLTKALLHTPTLMRWCKVIKVTCLWVRTNL